MSDKVKAALAAMRARCEAATTGPWSVRGQRVESIAEVAYCPASCAFGRDGSQSIEAGEAKANARFTASARTDLPKLLAVAEAVDRWRGAVCERDEFLFKHPSPDRWADETRAAYGALDVAADEREDALCAALAALGEP